MVLVSLAASAASTSSPAPAPVAAAVVAGCAASPLQPVHFTAGETLTFNIDALGADVGTADLTLEPAPPEARPRAAWAIRAHARTSAFVSTNVKRYDAFVTSLLTRDFAPLRYKEELDEGETHKAQDIEFPPHDGQLSVHYTKNGEPDPVQLAATAAARDLVSTFYLLREQPLTPGAPFCLDVYAGKKMWRVSGQAAAREEIDTPLGHLPSVRIDISASRIDDPKVVRTAHVWVSDDARKLPLVAIAEIHGRVLRAQLTKVTGGRTAPRARASREEHPGTSGIGR